jgi:hypothetical protein
MFKVILILLLSVQAKAVEAESGETFPDFCADLPEIELLVDKAWSDAERIFLLDMQDTPDRSEEIIQQIERTYNCALDY